MDRLTDKEEIDKKEKEERKGFLGGLKTVFTEARGKTKKERQMLYDLILVLIGFLFARCHLLFGAYPLAISFVASLPFGVWNGLLGSVIGALSLGKSGVAFAVISVVVAFIRVIISGGERERGFFSENTLLKMCSAVIGGFISAAYQLLLTGLSESSILFSISMILIPAALTFVFSGIFSLRQGVFAIFGVKENILDLKGKAEKERYNIIYFEISALVFLFFVTLSLGEIELLGVSFSYVFVSFVTLAVAKRFGALRALAVGFASSLGVSGVYSVSFALLGLVSGCLFGFGSAYGLLGGGSAAVLWSVYSSGVTGLLSTLPEYAIAAILAFPVISKLSPENTVSEDLKAEKGAKDMIGTMALVYQKKFSENLDALEVSLGSIPDVLKKRENRSRALESEECVILVESVAREFCSICPSSDYCEGEGICPAAKNAKALSAKILSGVPLSGVDINLADEFCQFPDEVAAALQRAVAKAEKEKFEKAESSSYVSYKLISSLLSEARMQDDSERGVNNPLSEKLTEILSENGFENGVGRVFGERRLHMIVAGEDEDGEKITSEQLRRGIEKGLGIRLSVPEFFRREKMVLMECDTLPSYRVEYAAAMSPIEEGECSGDSVRLFDSGNGYFYCLISDGMGSGKEARDASGFVCDFLEKMLEFSASKDTVLHLLNHSLRQRDTECSATVDLFGIDLSTGEVNFVKSGAAPSFVKRDSSIFRLRSKTAPLGLLSTIDSEKLRVEVRPSDYVVMLSDGICQSDDDSAWLIELLSKPVLGGLKDYAEYILGEAKKHAVEKDDMSVVVMRIISTDDGNFEGRAS